MTEHDELRYCPYCEKKTMMTISPSGKTTFCQECGNEVSDEIIDVVERTRRVDFDRFKKYLREEEFLTMHNRMFTRYDNYGERKFDGELYRYKGTFLNDYSAEEYKELRKRYGLKTRLIKDIQGQVHAYIRD